MTILTTEEVEKQLLSEFNKLEMYAFVGTNGNKKEMVRSLWKDNYRTVRIVNLVPG